MIGFEKRAHFAQNVGSLLDTRRENVVSKLETALCSMSLAASVPEIRVPKLQYRTERDS